MRASQRYKVALEAITKARHLTFCRWTAAAALRRVRVRRGPARPQITAGGASVAE